MFDAIPERNVRFRRGPFFSGLIQFYAYMGLIPFWYLNFSSNLVPVNGSSSELSKALARH